MRSALVSIPQGPTKSGETVEPTQVLNSTILALPAQLYLAHVYSDIDYES